MSVELDYFGAAYGWSMLERRMVLFRAFQSGRGGRRGM